MKFLTTVSGRLSFSNLASLLLFVSAAFEIWKPYIPAEYTGYILAAIATLYALLRTFQTDGEAIKK